MRARYLVVCLLAGVAVCSVFGALTGVWTALTGTPGDGADGGAGTGPLLGVAFGSLLAGLILGAALGAVLGGLSGLVATAAARGTRDPGTAMTRVGLSVLLTYAVALLVLAGATGGLLLGGGLDWQLPDGWAWLGIAAPSLGAAVLSGWAARSVATMSEPTTAG